MSESSFLRCLNFILLIASTRKIYLDSTRGIAAMMVLLAHTLKTFSPSLYSTFPLNIMWDGDAAVLYFFILSGFVLNESLQKKDLKFMLIVAFVRKRFLRIYPAFLVIFLFSVLLFPFYAHPTSSWLALYWQFTPDWKNILQQSILLKRIPNEPTLRILPHDWTLSIEILISLFIPLMTLIARKNSILLLVIIYFLIKFFQIETFAWEFGLGVVISQQKEKLQKFMTDFSIWMKIPLVILALLFLAFANISTQMTLHLDNFAIHSKSIGLSILLILLLSSKKMQSLLENNFIHFHGKVSYSLYLIHFILIAIVFHFFPKIDLLPALLIVYSLSMLMATASYHWIEKTFVLKAK